MGQRRPLPPHDLSFDLTRSLRSLRSVELDERLRRTQLLAATGGAGRTAAPGGYRPPDPPTETYRVTAADRIDTPRAASIGQAGAGTSTVVASTRPTAVGVGEADAAASYVQTYRVRPSGPPSSQAKAPWRGGDPFEHLSPVGDAHDGVAERIGHPHRALGVEGDAVGHDLAEIGEHAPSGQAAVGRHVERGQSVGRRLGGDERRSIRCDHAAVGEVEVVGHHGGAPSTGTSTSTPGCGAAPAARS